MYDKDEREREERNLLQSKMDKALLVQVFTASRSSPASPKAKKKSSPKRAKNGPTRPTNSRCLERNRIYALCIVGNHRILSPRRSRWHLRARAVSRSNPLLPPKFLSHKKKDDDEEFVNETTSARCELRAYLCCSSTRSERSFRLTRMIATRMPFLLFM